VGDDDLVESLVGETEPIQPLQVPQAEDYNDPNWEPEPIDAGPGRLAYIFDESCLSQIL
jgi:anaphase-promoting complex subunit 2